MIGDKALEYFKLNHIPTNQFGHFDYADFIEQLDLSTLKANPRKRRIIENFLKKCEQKLIEQKKVDHELWREFLSRSQQQKQEAQRFINEHYDSKNKQLLFYPKINKPYSIQKGRNWKDRDNGLDQIGEETPIFKPNESMFHTTC